MKRSLIVLLAAISVALAGCLGGSGGSNRNAPLPPSGPTAEVRVLHASSDAPAVDIYVNDDLLSPLTALEFGEATGFLSVPAEQLIIDIRAAGALPDSEPVFSATVTPTEGDFFTLVAYGLLGGEGDNAFDLLVIPDDQTASPGNARVFVLHAAPLVGNVDVYVDTDDNLGVEPVLSNFVPKTDSVNYLDLSPDDYRIRITPAGDRNVIAYDSGYVPLQAGVSYLLAALDRESGLAPASLIALTGGTPPFVLLEDQRAQVRAIHASPDAPRVEVQVDGEGTGIQLDYLAFSDYVTLLAGDYQVGVVIAADGTDVQSIPVTLEAGESYSVLATGFATMGTGPTAFQLRAEVDQLTPAEGDNALVRVIHAAPGAPNVDVLAGAAGQNNQTILGGLENVPYYTASPYLPVAAGTYDISVNITDTLTTVIDLSATTLDAGSIYTVIATGEVPPPLDVILITD